MIEELKPCPFCGSEGGGRMTEYIITDEQAKEVANQLPPYYVPTWLHLWVHTKYPYVPPNDWVQVREEHIGISLPEIVRCRDCKCASVDEFGNGWCNENCREIKTWDFCAWGERKEKGKKGNDGE